MCKTFLFLNSTLNDAINVIESTNYRIAIVINNNNKLLGTVTDGDIRRHLIKGGQLNDSLNLAMNKRPIYAYEHSSEDIVINLMRKNNIISIPIVDKNHVVIKVVNTIDIISQLNHPKNLKECFTEAIIIAGGRGERLMPLTKNIPKPMLKINGVPILELIINNLKNYGIKKVYLTLNYLSNVIEDYFKDGSDYGLEIQYVNELEMLGTIGSLSLVNPKEDDLLVLNADVITNFDISNLYNFYKSTKADITIAATHYEITIPYGVLELKDENLKSIKEKPRSSFFCNAGIYVISKKSISSIKYNTYMDMPEFINKRMELKDKITVFPIFEFWSDVGNINDLQLAREYFKRIEH